MSLPGADELFRTTGGMALQSSSPAERERRRNANANGEARVPNPAGPPGEGDPADGTPTGGPAASPAEEHSATAPDAAESSRGRTGGADAEQSGPVKNRRPQEAQGGQQRRRGRGANRRPSGRERHDEKITVYVSAEELMDLEHARLVLRGEHGLAVDRGRIVREAVAVVLADLESRGDASILVRRLRGR
ncbi:hypothetical protein [Streptomyces liangshanensis]|uniref:Cobyrinic acid a,c-diamide synthase n=1 Tax=Streptomyces liangshanensis TaxID=2717324 RepID=A0A6G9H9G9_9ACTN|nr:hypothetical protein HA039_27110 [Streptomyces liangshanensis]